MRFARVHAQDPTIGYRAEGGDDPNISRGGSVPKNVLPEKRGAGAFVLKFEFSVCLACAFWEVGADFRDSDAGFVARMRDSGPRLEVQDAWPGVQS